MIQIGKKMRNNLPPEKYLKINPETAIITLRVSPDLKRKVESKSQELNTSVNRFGEASLKWYLDKLASSHS